jgi:hypothetical protein
VKKISAMIKTFLYHFREAIHLWFGLRVLLTKNISEDSTYDRKSDECCNFLRAMNSYHFSLVATEVEFCNHHIPAPWQN